MPKKKKLVYEMLMPIRWGDMDAMGHLNTSTTYFRDLVTRRIDLFQALSRGLYSGDFGSLIVNGFCNFYRQLEYPGDMRMKMYVS